MYNLTAAISPPNITRIEAVTWTLDSLTLTGYVTIAVRSNAQNAREKRFRLRIGDDTSERLIVNPAALEWGDHFTIEQFPSPGLYTALEAADTGANRAAKKRSIETALAAGGCFYPNTVGGAFVGTVT